LFSYTAYGLGIHSYLSLPELPAGNGKADVIFRPGNVDGENLQPLDETRSFAATATEARYSMEGVGKFLVRSGREVIVDPKPGADERTVRLCLLGPVAGLFLHQRGWLTLHASAVAVEDSAIVFMGGQAWGKSTLAAAFNARGYGMLSDDVTAIRLDSDRPVVLPAFPQIKLWPKSVEALGDVPESLPVVHPDLPKRALRVTSGFAQAPLSLKRIYALAVGESVEIESLSPQAALVELICHSYAARFGKELIEATGPGTHFKQCARVAQNTSVCRFRRPASLSVLDEQVSLLVKDF